jgi:glycosyl transferase-like sugar-binding protein
VDPPRDRVVAGAIEEEHRPPRLVQFWHEEPVPDDVAETLASFGKHNPGMEQLVFDEAAAGTFIAEHRGPRAAAAFGTCAVPAMQADYFRYCAVHALGGVYADANFHCLGSLEGLTEGGAGGTLFGREDPLPSRLAAAFNWPYPVGPFRAVPNGLFGFRAPGHPLLELAIDAATANVEARLGEGSVGVWLTTGPGIFTSAYLLRELGSFDAFTRYARGTVLEPVAPLFCEVVGTYSRIAGAWDDVEIRPLGQSEALVTKEGRPGISSWRGLEGSLFR